MALRLIVAISLVAFALSAPTWTSQLSGLPQLGQTVHTSQLAVTTTKCHCTGCEDSFIGPISLSKDECINWCTDDSHIRNLNITKTCKFALHDSQRPVTNSGVTKPTGTCWLYDHLPQETVAKSNTNTHDAYTCFTADTAAPTNAPTSSCTMSTLAQNNFDDRGDTTLSTSTTYQYTLSAGYTCKLSGWTHTRNYHKGFLRNSSPSGQAGDPGSGQAEVSGLVAGQTYQWRVYQYASTYTWSNTNAITVNGVSKGTTSSTTDTSGGPTLTGTSTADSNGKITFVFARQNGAHVALSGIAMCPA